MKHQTHLGAGLSPDLEPWAQPPDVARRLRRWLARDDKGGPAGEGDLEPRSFTSYMVNGLVVDLDQPLDRMAMLPNRICRTHLERRVQVQPHLSTRRDVVVAKLEERPRLSLTHFDYEESDELLGRHSHAPIMTGWAVRLEIAKWPQSRSVARSLALQTCRSCALPGAGSRAEGAEPGDIESRPGVLAEADGRGDARDGLATRGRQHVGFAVAAARVGVAHALAR